MVKQQQQHHHHVIIEKIWKSMREKDEKRNHRFCKGSLVWTVCLCVRVVCCMFMYSYVKIDNVTFMMTFCHSFAQIIWYSVLVLIKLSQMWFAHGLWVIRNSRWSITIIWIIGYVSFIFHFSLSSNPRFIEKKNRFCNWLDSPLTSFMLWCCMPSIRIRYTHSLQCHFFFVCCCWCIVFLMCAIALILLFRPSYFIYGVNQFDFHRIIEWSNAASKYRCFIYVHKCIHIVDSEYVCQRIIIKLVSTFFHFLFRCPLFCHTESCQYR